MKTWQKLRNDPSLWSQYVVREKVLRAIRHFFSDRGFHEVETPSLTASLPPESYLDVFETTLYSRDREETKVYLPTSPEPFLKKLLVAGIGNCFSLTKSFRNTEDKSTTHNPEFTILEWYRVDADYTDIMKDCEDLLQFVHTYLTRTAKNGKQGSEPESLVYQGNTIDLVSPWQRVSVADAFKTFADIDLGACLDKKSMVRVAKEKGYHVYPKTTWEQLYDQILLNEIEPHLGRGKPTILYDYPASQAALSRKKPTDPRYAERFEFYIEGLELGDGYSELTDPEEQLSRFHAEYKERKRLGKVVHPIDLDFIEALHVGMPETGGIAVGVDRLIMLFADTNDIADTMFFPGKDLY